MRWTLCLIVALACTSAHAAESKKTKSKPAESPAQAAAPAAPAEAAPSAGTPATGDSGGMGGYSKMKIDHAGQINGNFNGAINDMSGDVRIELLSDDAAKGNLPISAEKIGFEWVEGSSQPKQIVLTGKVHIKHPQADVSAEKAVWNFETGELVFTGNPVMDSPQAQDMHGEKMTLNMESGTFSVTGVTIKEVNLGGMTGPGGPGAGAGSLSDADVADWPGLINALKKGENEPAKHVVGLLDPGARKMLMDTPTDLVVQNKGKLSKALNGLLQQPAFYTAEAWSGVTLPEGIGEKLAQKDLAAGDRTAANKAAFKAAFAKYVN